MKVVSRLYSAVFKRIAPERYARSVGVKMGAGCRLIDCDYSSEPYLITLGDRVSATKVRFETHDGGVWVFREKTPNIDLVRPIKVGSNVFLGFGAVVMPGVTIGDNVVIGARAVVTKDIPSNSVAVGVPARIIKTIEEYRNGVSARAMMTRGMSVGAKRSFYMEKFGEHD